MDPIEGGTANAYVYVSDPINGNDYSGLLGVVMSSSNIRLTVVNNYGMQGSSIVTLQSAVTFHYFQATAPAAATQGPGSARSSVGRTSAPVQAAAPVLQRVGAGVVRGAKAAGGGMVSGGAWFGNGVVNGAQRVWNNPQVQGAGAGCVMGVGGALAWSMGTWLAGGPFATAGSIAGSCAFGGLGGYYDSILEGTGQPFRDLDTLNGVYDTFRYFNYR